MEDTLLIDRIIELEWDMFSSVFNVGGPASCQGSPETFQIMRRSQAQTWSPALLESYREDLEAAHRDGINLMTQKYARMMEYTHPEEYEDIKGELPPVDEQSLRWIDEIVAVNLAWEQDLSTRYPRLRAQGRPANSRGDSTYSTSVETYLRSELLTFSPRSIEIYYQDTLQAQAKGMNQAEQNLLLMVRSYGYSSLEEAEKRLVR